VIGWLSGVLRGRFGDRVLVDAGGVGYELTVPASLSALLVDTGSRVELYVHTHVREDEIALYGFPSFQDRQLFLVLTSVSGVGPKTALSVCSAFPRDRIVEAIRTKNISLLQTIPGIGKRTAERIVVELKDRLKEFAPSWEGRAGTSRVPETDTDEVISALVNLGYRRPAAEAAFAQIDLSKTPTFDSMLKETLKILAKSP
jgi:holliday junction DNA helicase RuvA